MHGVSDWVARSWPWLKTRVGPQGRTLLNCPIDAPPPSSSQLLFTHAIMQNRIGYDCLVISSPSASRPYGLSALSLISVAIIVPRKSWTARSLHYECIVFILAYEGLRPMIRYA